MLLAAHALAWASLAWRSRCHRDDDERDSERDDSRAAAAAAANGSAAAAAAAPPAHPQRALIEGELSWAPPLLELPPRRVAVPPPPLGACKHEYVWVDRPPLLAACAMELYEQDRIALDVEHHRRACTCAGAGGSRGARHSERCQRLGVGRPSTTRADATPPAATQRPPAACRSVHSYAGVTCLLQLVRRARQRRDGGSVFRRAPAPPAGPC